jgi:hypothetical protein
LSSYGEADPGDYPGKRFLAADEATGDADDLPMYLLVSTIIPSTLYFFLSRFYFQWKNIELSKYVEFTCFDFHINQCPII